MTTRQFVAVALALLISAGTMPISAAQQGTGTLSGTAKDEARRPYTEYSARAREAQKGQIASTVTLDTAGNFSLGGLPAATYVVELINRNGRVVCTEGPFNLAQQPDLTKKDVNVNCGSPAALWLLGAAAAAGITAGVVASGPASAAQ